MFNHYILFSESFLKSISTLNGLSLATLSSSHSSGKCFFKYLVYVAAMAEMFVLANLSCISNSTLSFKYACSLSFNFTLSFLSNHCIFLYVGKLSSLTILSISSIFSLCVIITSLVCARVCSVCAYALLYCILYHILKPHSSG